MDNSSDEDERAQPGTSTQHSKIQFATPQKRSGVSVHVIVFSC